MYLLKFLVILITKLLVVNGQLWRGSECTFNGRNGRCVPLQECNSAIEMIKKGVKPMTCVFEESTPIVCCTGGGLTSGRVGEKSLRKCQDYNNRLIERLPGFYGVVGGTDAKNGDFPHMAALGYGSKNNIKWLCGGSLISDNYVLTAAHCLTSDQGEVRYVRLGDVALNGTSGTHKDYNVIQTIQHPEYRPPSVYNDIALIKLERNVEFTKEIKPGCLYTESSDPSTTEIKATGWGLTQFGGSASNILQEVYLQIFTHPECNQIYKANTRRLSNGIRNEIQLCAGGRNEEKDTCQGDSGGPLQFKKPDELYKIIGVTSFGKSCGTANLPGVYTRVSNYVGWIENIVWP